MKFFPVSVLIGLLFTCGEAHEDGNLKKRELTPITGGITGFELIDADKDVKIMDLYNGTVVSLCDIFPNLLPRRPPPLNVNATFNGAGIDSVKFGWNSNGNARTEVEAPYALCGNIRTDFFACTRLGVGKHTISATPRSNRGRTGQRVQVTFEIIPCAPSAMPSLAPSSTPSAAPVKKPNACTNCQPSNGCFLTTCEVTGCNYTAIKTCPTGQSCEPATGNCLNQTDLRPCVAVIDESDSFSNGYFDDQWEKFREDYPKRPFCLLQPHNAGYDGLHIPANFTTDPLTRYIRVTREDGLGSLPNPPLSDWYSLCGIGAYVATGVSFVGLYIDVSGSMTLATVQNQRDNFIAALNSTGLTYKTLVNPNEEWILPFQVELS